MGSVFLFKLRRGLTNRYLWLAWLGTLVVGLALIFKRFDGTPYPFLSSICGWMLTPLPMAAFLMGWFREELSGRHALEALTMGYPRTLLGLTYLVVHIGFRGGSFDLNAVIMLFLFAGLLLHKTPLAYVRAFGKAASGASGILLQFPFYAGIMGIITGVGTSGTCLGMVLSNACVEGSGPITYPLLTFLCAALLNLFVPSGGGHWAIQAPIMFGAGEMLNVDHGLTGIAIAWGDAWTNLIQPFWALPALAIAKLQAKDIMGYCLIDLIVSGVIIVGGLLVWSIF